MTQIVYVQLNDSGHPYSVHGAAAGQGFNILGFDVRYFRPAQLSELPLTRETVVVGGMGTVRAALEQIGISPPLHVSLPAVLHPFLGRECWRTTPQELRQAGRYPVFIKPYEQAKVFNGRVVRNGAELERLLAPRDGFPAMSDDFPLLAQEPVNFLSEWRVFIARSRVVGVSHYEGEPLLFPAAGAIRTTLGAYQNAPAGFSADFGVTDDQRTLLIEVNDGYSLGHGGLPAHIYAELLKARWNEITHG